MTVTVAPTVEASNVPPRVRLNVTASAGETSTTVTRLDADGRTRTVRTSDGAPQPISSGTALLYDYEMPYGQAVSYSSLTSPATVSAQVTVAQARAWLVHPGVPALSQQIVIGDVSERKRSAQRGVFYPMGRATPVVQTDGQRKAAEYTLTVYAPDEAAVAAVWDLLEDAGVLLLNVPAPNGWGIGAEYVSVGDVSERRLSRYVGAPERMFDLTLQVVDRPAGGTQAQRTYVDVLADNATYASLMTRYSSYSNLLAGP